VVVRKYELEKKTATRAESVAYTNFVQEAGMSTRLFFARYDVSIALVLGIQVFWFVRPSSRVIDARRFEGTYRLHVLKGEEKFFHDSKMEVPCYENVSFV
jgi:hypothetical protein